MFTFLVSLFTMFAAPTGLATAPAPIAPVAASRQLDWLGGIWRGGGLEMKCGPTKQGVMCSEEGTSAAMQGAKAELTFDTLGDRAVLELALPSIPPSRFTEVARDAQSVTFEMPTKAGTARLRFTRTGDALKVERGSAKGWVSAMEYQRG
ncbi:hypothetical protein LRS12_02615 [Sphingomonas sp. J344]|uniref:hypothetical protein n=1 Tax=Sphingomonas sp. J344 TaxID=2898434 RepID=UPI0021509D12|nr:hypothetical protein [Sphingomonas sp. J344]MCR5869744.1 hypothetical protein [Sphingomonas sp. J344]